MHRFLKVIFWSLGALVLLCLICIMLLPYVISSPWGTKKAVEWFNSVDRGTLSVENIEVSWFGQQSILNLVYRDENDNVILSINTLNTKTSLLYLLFGGRSLGKTVIREPYIVIEQEDRGEEPEKESEKKKKERKTWAKLSPKIKPGLDADFSVYDGLVIFKSSRLPEIMISAIRIQKLEHPNVYQISAQTKQGGTEGSVEIEISLLEKIQAKGEVKNFPVAVLDQFDQSTLYTDAIGNTLDIHFDLSKELDETLSISAEIKSQNLNGSLKGETREKKLYLDPSSHLVFTVTPKFFKFLLPESQKDEWSLAGNTNVKFEITKGIFPLTIKKPDYHEIVLRASGSVERAEIAHKTLSSYSLNNFSIEVTALDNLEIHYKGDIQGREPSVITGNISVTPDGDIFFSSSFMGFPISLIQLISPSIEKNIRVLAGDLFDLNTEGTYQDGKLDMQFSLAAPNMHFGGQLSGVLDNMAFDITGSKTFAGRPAEYFGKTMDFQFEGLANLSRQGASIPLLNGTLITPYYEVAVKGTIGERGKQLDLNEVELIATGEILDLPYSEKFPNVTLKNGGFFVNMDGPSNKIFGKAFVNTRTRSDQKVVESKALQGRFEITDYIRGDDLDFKNANISFSSELDSLPLAILNPLMPGDLEITDLFGSTATVNAKGSYTPSLDPRFSLDFNAKGEGIQAALSIAINGTLSVTQNQPAFIHWELTPERYHALIKNLRPDHQPVFQLTHPASVDLSIKELTCPTTPPKGVGQFLCETGFVGNLSIGMLTFDRRGTQEYLIIKNTAGSIEGENFSKAIDLHFHGDILASNIPQSESSSFQFDGVLVNFWTPDGKFNRKGLAVEGELNVELLPVRQATEIYPLDQETKQLVQAILGELMNARISGRISQLTGPLTIDVKSSNFKALLPILLHPNAIYLRDVVDAEITLTPEVNQTLLKDINPLLITGAYSDHPIRVLIDPQGFVLPIRPYFLQGVQIEKAMIDIGRIRVRNGGQIQQLMNFLKATDITPEGEMTAWFTPIYMSLKNGVASYNRFDMLLANEFHIALWGSINLITNQVNMTLGIAPSTLKKRFNIGGISKKHLFQVKMRGTTEKLDLDWSAASTRIGILVAKTATGHLGAIIGGILEQIIGTLGEEPSPPPTTTPFPWEG